MPPGLRRALPERGPRRSSALISPANPRPPPVRPESVAFGYPDPEREAGIVAQESGLALEHAAAIVAFGLRTRRLQGAGLDEGASTRMPVTAATLAAAGLGLPTACRLATVDALGDDTDVHAALQAALDASF